MEKMKKKKSVIAVSAIACVMLIGGVSAYFITSDTKDNVWTVGNVDVQLLEPEYDDAGTENLVPDQKITKDPQIKNTGVNDAFVFVEFTVPKKSVKIAGKDGTVSGPVDMELFDFDADSNWVMIDSETDVNGVTYVYAYGTDEKCTALESGDTTSSVFKDGKISFINIIEGQVDESIELPVNAYAIQTTDLGENSTDIPESVWQILSKQTS